MFLLHSVICLHSGIFAILENIFNVMYTRAIVRKPGKNFAAGISTAGLGKPDLRKALQQHAAYCETLNRCGLEVIVLEADERYPDGCFVEDTAVVTDETAIITRPGAISRRGEEEEILRILSVFRTIRRIESPGTLDGGDVLRVNNHFYIGLSGRTNREGAGQLAAILSEHGYSTSEAEVKEGLHLKSGIAYLGHGKLISTPALSHIVKGEANIITDEDESYSANCLRVNDFLLIPEGFPKTKMKMAFSGFSIIGLGMSEFMKMDGGLTCLSLLLA